MAYYLRKENKKKVPICRCMNLTGIKKETAAFKSVMAFGYVHELISDEIPDPVAYYTDFVAEKTRTCRRIHRGNSSPCLCCPCGI